MKNKQRKETLRKDGQLVKMRTKYENYWVQKLKNVQAFDLKKNPNMRSQNLRFYYLMVKPKSKRYKKYGKREIKCSKCVCEKFVGPSIRQIRQPADPRLRPHPPRSYEKSGHQESRRQWMA